MVATVGSVPKAAMPRRGQRKSSLRPAGGVSGSPLISTRVTRARSGGGGFGAAPSRS